MKKKVAGVEKAERKVRKKPESAELAGERELRVRELSIAGDTWVERERAAVRDIQAQQQTILQYSIGTATQIGGSCCSC